MESNINHRMIVAARVFTCTSHLSLRYKFQRVVSRDPLQGLSKRKQFILLVSRIGSRKDILRVSFEDYGTKKERISYIG